MNTAAATRGQPFSLDGEFFINMLYPSMVKEIELGQSVTLYNFGNNPVNLQCGGRVGFFP
jgi:hypothetical protein